MSNNESLVDSAALSRLAKSFESYGTDLESSTRDFRSKTDSEVIHDGFSVLTESQEVTSAPFVGAHIVVAQAFLRPLVGDCGGAVVELADGRLGQSSVAMQPGCWPSRPSQHSKGPAQFPWVMTGVVLMLSASSP
ncbi:hypothetical protein [Streptomyces sp. A1-5]|uniref:hypothetical protein n=1 Tax=Streptomyces sp. A1-5 TaxID=2738410 RepID=UPI001F3BCF1F|nr:hypothetical protein [Streptomyces sp. A1-5]UJB40130.1 hypothetical protein HRD51_03885 [Streptomyces sp. A1-5]